MHSGICPPRAGADGWRPAVVRDTSPSAPCLATAQRRRGRLFGGVPDDQIDRLVDGLNLDY